MYVCIQLQSVDLWKSHTIYGRKWMPPSVPYSEVSLYIIELLKKPQVFHVVLSNSACQDRQTRSGTSITSPSLCADIPNSIFPRSISRLLIRITIAGSCVCFTQSMGGAKPTLSYIYTSPNLPVAGPIIKGNVAVHKSSKLQYPVQDCNKEHFLNLALVIILPHSF